MGYTTDFRGEFAVTPPLKTEHREYLKAFSNTRRMKRDEKIAATFPDPVREAAGLPVGFEGSYFVGGRGFAGQERDESILDYNIAPGQDPLAVGRVATRLLTRQQPGLWCQWTPNEDGTAIVWNEAEKFYDYVDWLKYLVEHFLKPWGYTITGQVSWWGQEPNDRGVIYAEDNRIEAVEDLIINPGPSWAAARSSAAPHLALAALVLKYPDDETRWKVFVDACYERMR